MGKTVPIDIRCGKKRKVFKTLRFRVYYRLGVSTPEHLTLVAGFCTYGDAIVFAHELAKRDGLSLGWDLIVVNNI